MDQQNDQAGALRDALLEFLTRLEEAVGAIDTPSDASGAMTRHLGALTADHVMRALSAWRVLNALLKRGRPTEGLYCEVRGDFLIGMATRAGDQNALDLLGQLEQAASYLVPLRELLAIQALMGPEKKQEPRADVADVPIVPPAPDNPRPANGILPGAPQPQPFPVAPTVARPAVTQPMAAALPAGSVRDGFVDLEAAGLEGLNDDDIVAAVTGGVQLPTNLSANPQPRNMGAGSSQNTPQPPGDLPQPHPLIQQARDPSTGSVMPGPVGPSPQELKAMRFRIESGQ